MIYPFSCLFYSSGKTLGRNHLLIAASGFSLYSLDISTERVLSIWPPKVRQNLQPYTALRAAGQATESHVNSVADSKVIEQQKQCQTDSYLDANFDDEVVGITSENADESQTLQFIPISRSPIINLIGSSNGDYVIAVTEDKNIRVLKLSPSGILTQLSQRQFSLDNICKEIFD